MALQTEGPISISDVATEFGAVLPQSLFELAQLAGIPTPVSLTDFYGLSAFTPYSPAFIRNTNVDLEVTPSILSSNHIIHSPIYNESYISDPSYALTEGADDVGGLHIFDNNTDGTVTYRETIISDSPSAERCFTGLPRGGILTKIALSEDGQHMYVPEFSNRAAAGPSIPGRIHHFLRSGNSWVRNTIITPTISNNTQQDGDSSIGCVICTNADGSRLFILAGELANIAGAALWVYDRIGNSFVERDRIVRSATDGSTLQDTPLPISSGAMECNAAGDRLVVMSTVTTNAAVHEVVTLNVSSGGVLSLNNISGEGEFGIVAIQLGRDLLDYIALVDSGNSDLTVRFNLQYFSRPDVNSTFTLIDTKTSPSNSERIYFSNAAITRSIDGEYVGVKVTTDRALTSAGFSDFEIIYLDGESITTTASVSQDDYTTDVGNNRTPNPVTSGLGPYVYDTPDGQKATLNFWLDFVSGDNNLYLAQFK